MKRRDDFRSIRIREEVWREMRQFIRQHGRVVSVSSIVLAGILALERAGDDFVPYRLGRRIYFIPAFLKEEEQK